MTANGFFQELQRIILSHPKSPNKVYNSENCLYADSVLNSKNLFYCFDCGSCSDCTYTFDSYLAANCVDCDYTVESELCYESVDAYKAYNCEYLEYCDNIRDSSYCYNCSGNNLFGCVNLNNKSFCIFNRQLTEEEYKLQIKRYKSLPSEKILAIIEDLLKQFPTTQTYGANNENTDYGNYIHFDKDCYLCFDAAHDENCGYLYDCFYCRSSYDMTYAAQNLELCYQVADCGSLYNCNYVFNSSDSRDSWYLLDCSNVKNSLGCVGLSNVEYCILNRQFTKEGYEKLSREIMGQLNSSNLGWNNIQY